MNEETNMNLIEDPDMDPKKVASILKTNPPENQVGNIATRAESVTSLWIARSGDYVALHWEANRVETYDYVALYNRPPNGDPWAYLTNQWQWTSNHSSPHVTNTRGGNRDWWIAYCRYSYETNGYQVQREEGPFRT